MDFENIGIWEDFRLTNCRLWGQPFCRIFSVLLIALYFFNVVIHMSIVRSDGKMETHISLRKFLFLKETPAHRSVIFWIWITISDCKAVLQIHMLYFS